MLVIRLAENARAGTGGSSTNGSSDDKILGEIVAVARLALGLERLRLIFTSERMIVAHVGKRVGSAAPFASLAGFLAAGIEDLFKGGRESVRGKRRKTDNPVKILEMDRDNFSIRYSDIIRMEIVENEGRTSIMVLSKDDKFQFISGTSARRVKEIAGNILGSKISMRKSVE
ncbi:MAG TPA: hypothetical protein VNA15_00180 [Candidatus Angelobacter sp.]|nr:hypothetical protein [Candidatus Angelobacter sp.]